MRPAKIIARRPELRLETLADGPTSVEPQPQRLSIKPAAMSEPVAPRRKGRTKRSTALVWGGIGFVAGAAFWHAVGFRSFVSDVVLQGSTQPAAVPVPLQEASLTTGSVPSADELPTIYMVDPASCTALALDRNSNRTTPRPCPKDGLALRLEPVDGREDLAVGVRPRIQAAGYRPD